MSTVERYEQADPDVRLMLQVRDDNAAAFEELVARYQSRLLTVLEHLCGSREQAEDLAQETFMRVYRARKRYSAEAKFATWLFTIANNVASNARRSQYRRREVQVVASPQESGPMLAEPMAALAVAKSGLLPTRRLDKREMADMVRQAMESLNERQRMAVLLSKFEEMSYQDIAVSMDLTVPAVKSLLSRARQNLKVLLEPYLQSGSKPASSVPDETGALAHD